MRCLYFLLSLLLLMPATMANDGDGTEPAPAQLTVANRAILTFHASVLGEPPAVRVQRSGRWSTRPCVVPKG
ncbi:hypothetical protein [Pseudomonas sp. RC3H12]|uniref:hypothetical protein n=1 Tax=Pseudomonas sp. RC3H12 TaxID=2834406 RepID=UPI001BDEE2A1|nr:hypothetical protein [Pseudomonas sp. RC3H12]QWA30324.1 hypothetical protein KHO27_05435 [Pseudomonas sp. RC3H12]